MGQIDTEREKKSKIEFASTSQRAAMNQAFSDESAGERQLALYKEIRAVSGWDGIEAGEQLSVVRAFERGALTQVDLFAAKQAAGRLFDEPNEDSGRKPISAALILARAANAEVSAHESIVAFEVAPLQSSQREFDEIACLLQVIVNPCSSPPYEQDEFRRPKTGVTRPSPEQIVRAREVAIALRNFRDELIDHGVTIPLHCIARLYVACGRDLHGLFESMTEAVNEDPKKLDEWINQQLGVVDRPNRIRFKFIRIYGGHKVEVE